MMRRGDYVQTWFDTGAIGVTILYGEVIAAGPKTYRVRWESGLTNRVRQDATNVRPARDPAEAAIALFASRRLPPELRPAGRV